MKYAHSVFFLAMSFLFNSLSFGDGVNLVHNGGFEAEGRGSPPEGWTMWGDERYKDQTNYTRDTTHAYSGDASYRIHHPADTDGYTVTDPQHAIRAEQGTSLTIRFWARADAPGMSVVGLGAYTTIDPYVDAPPPGFWGIEVGPEWSRNSFVVHEGLDFFAGTSRLLMPTFRATVKRELERTLWIDDVVITTEPRPEGMTTLIAPEKLSIEPISHEVTPGESFAVRVDTHSPGAPANRMAAGVSFHRVRGHPNHPFTKQGGGPSVYNLAPSTEQGIRDLQLPWTRFYALGDEPQGAKWSIDRVADLCQRFNIPMDRVVLELEIEYADTRISPEGWADAVQHSIDQGYGFRHWEIGNEVYAAAAHPDKAFNDSDDYIGHLIAVSQAIKEVQPEALIGASIGHELKWGDYVMARAAGHYDFVVPHLYAFGDAYRKPFEFMVLEENRLALNKARRLRALVDAYNPDRTVQILDTEWGLHSNTPDGRDPIYANRNANVIGMLHRAVRMIHYVRGGYVDGASTWTMFGSTEQPGFCVLPVDEPEKRTMLFWLYTHFNRHLGETRLPVSGTAPFYQDPGSGGTMPRTPMVVTRSADGRTLYAIIANASQDTPEPVKMTLAGTSPGNVNAYALSQDSLDASAILPDGNDPATQLEVTTEADTLLLTVPPRSVVFLSAMIL
ncbi:MAG: hypothetical protein PF795_13300 [Kiritimatiellae bacterium]|jgi:hypothetical protein|nr:hypothetical protein [Kiritimatiellia bacterium]